VSESGYRLYGDAELEHLEHILALRFIGFSLDQIKKLLAGSDLPLAAALRPSVGRFFAPSWRYLKCKTIGSGRKGITRKRRAKRSTSTGVACRLRSSSEGNETGRHSSRRSKPRLHATSNRRAQMLECWHSAGVAWSRSLRKAIPKFHGG
jgi:DNA-binding transcriptional MerR regulator